MQRQLSWGLLARLVVLAALVCVSTAAAAAPEYQLDANGLVLKGVSPACPMVYDNDWWGDTPDKNYLWAKASLGQVNLRANIVTRDLWNWQRGYRYTLKQGTDDAKKAVAIARRSGLKNLPDPTAGCDRAFARPSSGRIEDTKPVASKGSELIVAEARKASPDKPLLVFVGGPLNTVANAVLADPSIAERMIVLMTDISGYNGKDPWANHVVAKRCKLVNFGAGRIWWPQRPKQPVMPLARFDALPKNDQTAELRRIARLFWDRSAKGRARDDGFGDGAAIFLVFRPKSWRAVQRQRVEGVWSVKDVAAGPCDLLDARTCDFDLMREEFFTTLAEARVYGEAEPGWISLFDGKTLTGWKAGENAKSWTVVDGALKGSGPRSHLFYVGPHAPFTNFEFQAEVKTLRGSNSGIYFHTRYQDGGWPSAGIESQVNNTHGDWKKTASLYNIVNVRKSAARDNEWWTQHIIVQGKRVIVKINGKTVVDWTQPAGVNRLGKGTFAFQQHDPGSTVFYRNVRVKPLK